MKKINKMMKEYYNQKLLKENYTFIISGRGTAKTVAMQEYYNKFIKEKEK